MANQGGFKYLAARYLELWVEIEVGDGQLSGVAIDGVVPERDGGAYRHCFGLAHGFIGKDVIITAKAARSSASDHASLTARFYQAAVRPAPSAAVAPAASPAAPSTERFRPKELVATATFGADTEIPLALVVRIA